MASIGSTPFTIDTKAIHINNHRRPRFCWHRNSLNFPAPRVAGTLHSRNGAVCDGARYPFSLRAAPNNAAEGNDRDESSEDSLQATIEKSKKVLAMQRDLLNQISSRRKLISSIRSNNSSSSTEDDSLLKEIEEQLSNLEVSSSTSNNANPNVDEEDKRKSPPSKNTTEVKKTITSNVTGGAKDKTDPEVSRKVAASTTTTDYQHPKNNVDSSGGALKTNTLPPFVSELQISPTQEEEKQDFYEAVSSQFSGGKNEPIEEQKPPLAGANVMNIILVSAECAPWSKTGGLGDVAGALPKALARRGHRVMVVAPRYGEYAEAQDSGVRKRYKVAGQDIEVSYFHAFIDGVDFVFIDASMFRHIDIDIYGGKREDILKRMVLFCKAAVEVPWYVPCGGICYGDGNLVFIANDWHTCLLPVYLKAYYRDNGLMSYTRSVIVIHNIAHQGRGPVDDFSFVDLPGHYLDLFRLYDPVGGEHFNIFAAGLKTADRIVTVSHGYAWEVKTVEGGWGLHNIINDNDWKLRGIVNGIDTEDWSPKFDQFLTSDGYTNYTLETLQTGKPQCKAALQRELGLPVRDDVPLIGFIGRLDHQKGVDLIAEAVPWMMSQDVQLVMLGTGRPDLEQMLRDSESHHKDKVRGWVGFSVKMAHRITAGVDILLMPSRFEPCGLNQLYAMSYGTIPVVHAVGGLRDTVQPFDPFNECGLGWTFDRAEADKLIYALGNCLWTYREFKESWVGLQRRGMMQDLSWDHAAEVYEEVLVAAKYQW